MVIDKLKNAPLYYGLGERFRKALEWLAVVDTATLNPGQRVAIEGENIFATMFDVETLPQEECRLEAHHNYADIQVVLSGLEGVGYMLDGEIQTLEAYDPQKDIGFYTGCWDTLTVRTGTFYIVWPQDLHAPRLALGAKTSVRRLVVKVKL